MPEFQGARTTAEPIGRISCIHSGREIGLLYRWSNGETQAALSSKYLERTTQMTSIELGRPSAYPDTSELMSNSRYRILL